MADMWRCEVCLEENILERSNCYSCLSFKPGPRTPPGPATPSGPITPPGPMTPPGAPPQTPPDPPPLTLNGTATKKTWKCRMCKTVNCSKSKQCYLCDAAKPLKRGSGRSSGTSPNDWCCKYCKSVNLAELENCSKCNSLREASTPTTPDVEYWACGSCAYKTSHGPYCFQCGEPRNDSVTPRGDNWDCPKCGKTNFAKRSQCYACHGKLSKKRSPAPQPWHCPSCKFINDKPCKECKLCLNPRPAVLPGQKRRLLKQSSSSSSSSNNISSSVDHHIVPKDWECQSCDHNNIALRNFCKECDTPRKSIAKLYIKYKKHGLVGLGDIIADNATPPVQNSVPEESPKPTAKACAKCYSPCDSYFCYKCASTMGIAQERESWECMHCHLVDENTTICMGCGKNKSESAALRFLTCSSCKTKNHSHKKNCVRCLKALQQPTKAPAPERASTPDSWKCQYCDISVLISSTHCRGCNRRRCNAEKIESPAKTDVPPVDCKEVEEGEFKEDEVAAPAEEPEYTDHQEYEDSNYQEDGNYDEYDQGSYHDEHGYDEHSYEETYTPHEKYRPPVRPPPGPPHHPPPGHRGHFQAPYNRPGFPPIRHPIRHNPPKFRQHRPPLMPLARFKGPRNPHHSPRHVLRGRRKPINMMASFE